MYSSLQLEPGPLITYLGCVYQAFEIFNNEEVVIKSALGYAGAVALKREYHILNELSKLRRRAAIPKALWMGCEDNLHVMVLEQLGPSLEECLHACGGRFSLNVVSHIANQLVCFDVSQHINMLMTSLVIVSKGYSFVSLHPP